jgi:hypothetical protein
LKLSRAAFLYDGCGVVACRIIALFIVLLRQQWGGHGRHFLPVVNQPEGRRKLHTKVEGQKMYELLPRQNGQLQRH